MTATNTDFINQILSSTARLCEKEKRCAGCFEHASAALPPDVATLKQAGHIKPVFEFFYCCPSLFLYYIHTPT